MGDTGALCAARYAGAGAGPGWVTLGGGGERRGGREGGQRLGLSQTLENGQLTTRPRVVKTSVTDLINVTQTSLILIVFR